MQRDAAVAAPPPFDPRLLAQLAAGDVQALMVAVASMANMLLQQAGMYRPAVYATELVSLPGVQAGKAAAALDLVRLLAHAPQGRQALRDFGLEPFLDQVEGE